MALFVLFGIFSGGTETFLECGGKGAPVCVARANWMALFVPLGVCLGGQTLLLKIQRLGVIDTQNAFSKTPD